jgi:hypothetical protein
LAGRGTAKCSPPKVLSDIFSGLDKVLAQLNQIHTPTSAAIYDQQPIIEENAPAFIGFFGKLEMVMSSMERKKGLGKPSGLPKTPPGQETVPVDPKYTHSSTGSGTSSQGKPEDPTKLLANELIQHALRVTFRGVGAADYSVMDWIDSPYPHHLDATYLSPRLLYSFRKAASKNVIQTRVRGNCPCE